MNRREFVLAAASAGVLGTAGCAGSDDTTSVGDAATATRATPTHSRDETRQVVTTEDAAVPDGVTPTPVGDPPEARIDATPIEGSAPLTVAFDGRGTTDPDGQIVEYIWLFKDMRPPATGPTVDHTFTSDGVTRPVELIVTDDDGNTDRATVEIRIAPASA